MRNPFHILGSIHIILFHPFLFPTNNVEQYPFGFDKSQFCDLNVTLNDEKYEPK